ncbi:MAG TPA: lyase family protein, partial [bacterium]|nr:lyase family protein [bacterium]
YWAMVSLPDGYVTGSSIMPQKRNPDFAEVIKGKSAWLVGMVAGLLALPKGDMSGYNRDSQGSKYAILDVVRECQPAPRVLQGALAALVVHPEAMRRHLRTGFLAAADFADALARALGLPFRQSYDIAAQAVRLSAPGGEITPHAATEALRQAGQDQAVADRLLQDLADPARVLSWRQHTGAPAPRPLAEHLDALAGELQRLTAFVPQRRQQVEAAYLRCRDYSVPATP